MTSRASVAAQLGVAEEDITDALLVQISDDPLFLDHFESCKDDPAMLALLLGEEPHPDATAEVANADLLGRAGSALARWAASGFRRIDYDAYQRRLACCESCEHLSLPPRGSILYRLAGASRGARSICGLCGCDVRHKARLQSEDCPDGRWEPQRS